LQVIAIKANKDLEIVNQSRHRVRGSPEDLFGLLPGVLAGGIAHDFNNLLAGIHA
jgi:hypothetical protein